MLGFVLVLTLGPAEKQEYCRGKIGNDLTCMFSPGLVWGGGGLSED